MRSESGQTAAGRRVGDREVLTWRRRQLVAAGFELEQAGRLARDERFDLHALIELVERGCPPALAVRILAPLDADPQTEVI
jgi:hypothetical protein